MPAPGLQVPVIFDVENDGQSTVGAGLRIGAGQEIKSTENRSMVMGSAVPMLLNRAAKMKGSVPWDLSQ